MACPNPLAPSCSTCSPVELGLGVCAALAETWAEAVGGAVLGWAAFVAVAALLRLSWTRPRVARAALLAAVGAGASALFLQRRDPSALLGPGAAAAAFRPPGACQGSGNECGMPSAHVAFAYAALVVLLDDAARASPSEGGRSAAAAREARLSEWLLVAALALQPWGRVAIRYHTPA